MFARDCWIPLPSPNRLNSIFFDYKEPIKYVYQNYNDMEKYINKIYSMDINKYIEITKELQRYVMNYDSSKPPHTVVHNQINRIMEKKHYVN